MSAFVIADITVNDPERYEEYSEARALRHKTASSNMIVVEAL